jgi:hypothetical protein
MASLELRKYAPERAGVEFIFGEGLVHALSAPADPPRIEGLMGNDCGLDGREIEVTEGFGGLMDDVMQGFGRGCEGVYGGHWEIGHRLL